MGQRLAAGWISPSRMGALTGGEVVAVGIIDGSGMGQLDDRLSQRPAVLAFVVGPLNSRLDRFGIIRAE